MSDSAKGLCWLIVVAATCAVVAPAMAGFAEPDDSKMGIMVWALFISVGLHAGLLGGLLGWKLLGNKILKWVIGLLMLPATLLVGMLLIGTLKMANWVGAAAAFLWFGIYLTVWFRLLGGFDSSIRRE